MDLLCDGLRLRTHCVLFGEGDIDLQATVMQVARAPRCIRHRAQRVIVLCFLLRIVHTPLEDVMSPNTLDAQTV
jgi:hypothetical protein